MHSNTPFQDRIQSRLLTLAAVFLGLYALTLTLSPAVRARSWEVDYRWTHWGGYLVWLILVIVAHRQTVRLLPERDPYLLPIASLLSGWGIMTIWRLYPSFGLRQAVWLFISVVILIAGLHLPGDLNFFRRYKYLWLTGGLILTALTLLLGTNPASSSGPRLWLGCCGIYFQPSEPLKLLLIIYLAAYLADRSYVYTLVRLNNSRLKGVTVRTLQLLAPTMVMTSLALLLLVVQRDLGTASIFIFLYMSIIYLATGQKLILSVSGLALVLSGMVGYRMFDVVRLRVDAWLNPWLDPSGRSYQIVQSLLAIANGGLLGRGPGLGNPALVPVPHSDFIFSAIAEEGGIYAILGLVALLALLVGRGLSIALHANDPFRRYLAAGLTAYLVAQSILIAGGNLRMLPLTGVTLPFVSYGGSSLLTSFLSVLLLLHISNRTDSRSIPLFEMRPYRNMGVFLLAGLGGVALTTGWWAYYRSPALLERTDNARRAIADRYVMRGSFLDRGNTPLVVTEGSPGNLIRRSLYPLLGPILGYNDPVYGQSGLEASLDPYLRGLRGNPGLNIWWNHMLYGQPPPGLDIRLSLDLALQRSADDLLGNRASALVLLNAQSGEILAMASHPTFDPNRLEQDWSTLIKDARTPLFNRVILGRYQPGGVLSPFLLADVLTHDDLPPLPDQFSYTFGDQHLDCAYQPSVLTWGSAVAAGCPAAQAILAGNLGEKKVLQLYIDLGLYSLPPVILPADSSPAPIDFLDPEGAGLGRAEVNVSPLQLALAAATLSNGGLRPAAHLAMAVNIPLAGWVVLPSLSEPVQVFTGQPSAAASTLGVENLPIWQSIAIAPYTAGNSVTWYMGGTLPSWKGAPLVLVVILEQNNPEQVNVIGQAMFKAVLNP